MIAEWGNIQRRSLPVSNHHLQSRPVPIKWPQWITINGQRMLVQFLQTRETVASTSMDVGRSISNHNLQLPNGHQGQFVVPTYSPSMPLDAFWVKFSGNEYALVHRQPKSVPNTANHHTRCVSGIRYYLNGRYFPNFPAF